MKKKEAENVQETESRSKKQIDLQGPGSGAEVRLRTAKPLKVTDDPRFTQAVQNYEAGLKALQSHKYDKAKACFEKVVGGLSPELSDRAAVHLNTCNQQLNRDANKFKTPEEQYDYAVSLMNMGDYVSAARVLRRPDPEAPQAGLRLVRSGRAELPDGTFSRCHLRPARGHPAKPCQPVPGQERLRFQEPGR